MRSQEPEKSGRSAMRWATAIVKGFVTAEAKPNASGVTARRPRPTEPLNFLRFAAARSRSYGQNPFGHG
ncbi:MAG: hypothetical protein A2Y36_09070 [Treponema sp. GWA1_62_8]|nr:MAG: hypothetical protein A2Y36_09070 [Treponema sp. GWA1_62_8]